MKRWFVVLLFAAAVAAADVNGIVLRVGDRIVTLYDYRQRYAERLQTIQRREADADQRAERLASAGWTTFCEIFQETLVLARADQQRLEVSDEQVDEAVAQSKENLGIETDEQFREALEASGMTEAVLREQMRRNLLVQQVMGNQLRDRVQLDEEDVRRYYQSHLEEFRVPRRMHLREFVVLETEAASAEADQLLAVTLAARAREVGLEAAAGQQSSGEVSEVIDLGWVESGDLDPSLEAAVWELSAGAISDPVAARGGVHVVEVIEVEEAHLLSFAEARERIEERERQRLTGEEMGAFMSELATTSYIVEQPPPEAVGYRERCLAGEAEEPTLEGPPAG